MSLSQAQTAKIKLHPLFFLQEQQHQRRGEIVNVITKGSDILLLKEFDEFCILEHGLLWGLRVSVCVPVPLAAPWGALCVFNFRVHEMSFRG